MKSVIVVVVALAVIAGLVVGVMVWSGSTGSDNTGGGTSSPATSASPSGLQVTDIKVGDGAVAAPGDTLTVSYVGTLQDGSTFDSNDHFSFVVGTGQVIKGWDKGMVGMKVGGERKLVIPPDLAYGSQAMGSIPPNSTLTFDVKLLDVKPGASPSVSPAP